jgi:Ca2+-transporting ATPase
MGQVFQLAADGAGRASSSDEAWPLRAFLVHRLPCRDRLKIPEIRFQPELGRDLGRALRRQPGLRRVRCRLSAASLVVEYQDLQTQERLPELLDALPGFRISYEESIGVGTPEPRSGKAGRAEAPSGSETDWHVLELAVVLQRLASQLEGLDPQEAERRLREQGPNVLRKMERRPDWRILLEQFQSAPVGMLGISAAVALATAAPLDAAIIVAVIGINAAIGFVTERQAEDTIASLAEVEGQQATVLRGGRLHTVDAQDIVPGDVLLLEPGSQLPADGRLLRAHHLTVDESSLTGESLPVDKRAEDQARPRTLAERRNMVFLGTLVSGGTGRAVVTATGDETELGRIQALASASEQPMTPMQRKLAEVSTQLAIGSSVICGLVFVAGLLRGQPRLAMLNSAISLAVAAVPEGLPAISNSLLAIGIRRMGRRNILARRMDAIENLGSIDVLCVDKTGTLTENRMRVMAIEVSGAETIPAPGEEGWEEGLPAVDRRFWEVLTLCNESQLVDGELDGSSTENALLEAVLAAGVDVDTLRHGHPRKHVRYRSERRQWMATVHEYPRKAGRFVAVKGRPRQVLARCTHLRRGGRRVRLTDGLRERILERNQALMAQSWRVLGVACKHQPKSEVKRRTQDLEWLGLVAMADPLRPEVKGLLPRLQRAGIRPVILTGDQRGTATAIGRELGLSGDGGDHVLGADELEQMSDAELEAAIGDARVFARVSPAMKLKLVQALQRQGHRVAMTGDGVNDGPALKVADVGIAMGHSGTEVARAMSDVVLSDDRLESIIEAIEHGRASYANLEKSIEYLLSTNFSEIEVMLAAIVAGLPTPLTPVQLLWINLLTDVFPSLAIGFEEPEQDVLERPPGEFDRGLFTGPRLRGLLRQSLIISGGALGAFAFALARHGPGPRAGTAAFMTLTLGQLLQALSSRSHSSSWFRPEGRPPNPWLTGAVAGSVGLQLATLLPGLRRLVGVRPLGPVDLAVVAAGAGLPVLVNEVLKERDLQRAEREPPRSGADGAERGGEAADGDAEQETD